MVSRFALVLAERAHLVLILSAPGRLEVCVGHWGWSQAHELAQGLWEGPQPILHTGQEAVVAFQLRGVTTLKGAFSPEGGALEAGERGGIDVVLVWDATVHWLTRHLLVPFAFRAGHCDTGSCLKGRGRYSEEEWTKSLMCGNTLLPQVIA